jgi:hypothetical protein
MRQRSNARGKWLAAALLTLGLIAALAEWKFRPRVQPGAIPAATTQATPP